MDSTTICNIALAKIGDLSILSLDDPTPEARFCKLFYTPTINECFRMHDWNWATGYAKLSPIDPPPEYDWAFAYGLPVDFGRLLTFNTFSPAMPVVPYQIVGRELYTDESDAVISYIKNIVDENSFDPLFVNLVSQFLAAKLARPLAGGMDMEKLFNSQAQATLAEARRIDAGEGIPKRKMAWVDSDLVRARYSGVI
jgi:hypothetical protein